MRAYSMDLRERVLLDSDAGMKAADVAAKYRVSGSWVRLLKQRRRKTGGASAIKCCYAATGIGMTAAAAALCELANTSTSLGDEIGLRGDVKMSRMVSRRVASPACIAGVRVSRPNFSARCGRTKL